ncbi:thiamine pyrophosphate-binding protein [Chloroflexota bacterium]
MQEKTSMVNGIVILSKALRSVGVDTIFYLMGGPMSPVSLECKNLGIRLIDVRHEQAAAMMAHAYSRVSVKPGVCMTGAGPDTMNLTTGLLNAFMDCCPLVAVCGSSSLRGREKGSFQEVNQLEVMKPIVKHAWQVPAAERIPAFLQMAFTHAVRNKPGPVYLEFPAAEALLQEVEESQIELPEPVIDIERPSGDPDQVKKAIAILQAAQRPIVLAGSGVIWSRASAELQEFIEVTGIPFYTTPLARGVIPEDHQLCFLAARSRAWREADALLVIGTRANFIVQHLLPPRFARDLKLIEVNIDAEEIGHNRRVDVGIVGDARAVLVQLIQEARSKFDASNVRDWVEKLRKTDAEKKAAISSLLNTDQKPIHPLRLCKEIRDFLPRDAILAVDGHEILNFARQVIPAYYPGHRLNPGPSGCMGVSVPFAIGAKVAKPEKAVMALSGDGSFGMNGMEIDTAVRHNIPVVVVISNNGSWASQGGEEFSAGRYLGFTRYDKIAETLNAWSAFVEDPEAIRPTLEQAFASGKPAVVNVITDPAACATTQQFADFRPV